MAASWMTKYGKRRVRHEPPTIAEALAAAEGLSDDPAQQVVLAAELMQVPVDEIRAEAAKIAASRPKLGMRSAPVQMVQGRGAISTVMVERKPQRRFSSAATGKTGIAVRRSV